MTNKTINVAHLYGDVLNSYSDNGNLLVLAHYAKSQGYHLNTTLISLGDELITDSYDFIFIGGGQNYEQEVVAKDILHKKKALASYIENNGVLLAIDSGFQLLGHSFENSKGEKIQSLGLLDHHTKRTYKRITGEIEINSSLLPETDIEGFENHPGETILDTTATPFGKVIVGNGNNRQDKVEGSLYKNTWATYLHGPLLARNPRLTEKLFNLILKQKS